MTKLFDYPEPDRFNDLHLTALTRTFETPVQQRVKDKVFDLIKERSQQRNQARDRERHTPPLKRELDREKE